jgi:hypothetical protein
MKLNVLPVRVGAQWVKLGIRTFFKQPLALGALYMLFLMVLLLVALTPIAGIILMLVLVPALTVGLMAATREADGGKIPLPAILFIAFRQGAVRTRAMIVLGLLYALAVMIVIGIAGLIDGQFLALILGHVEVSTPEQFQALLVSDPRLSIAISVSVVLYAPVSLTFWYAPALTHWHGVPPIKSLFFSCVAVLKNTRPFLLYGLLWVGLSIGAAAALITLAILAGSASILVLGQRPIALFLDALLFTSLWFTFRDSFAADPSPDDALPPGNPAPR